MSPLLDDKVAIVTGAAKGIGLAIATKVAAAGAKVVLVDIDSGDARPAASAVQNSEVVACDVREEAQVARLVRETVERHGRLDVMVANAGVATASPLVQATLEEWRDVLAVDLGGVFLCTKHAALAMVGNGGGSIVNIASIKAFGGSPGMANYGAAKAWVVSLTKTAALELRPQAVHTAYVVDGGATASLI